MFGVPFIEDVKEGGGGEDPPPPRREFTADIPEDFEHAFLDVCTFLECAPLDLLGNWYSESSLRADAHNPAGDASGIFQAMPATLRGLGFSGTHEDFRKLTATEQLPWASRYYGPHKGLLISTAACYTATFLPALLPHAGDMLFILCAANGPLAWAYPPNKGAFDPEDKGYITVGDLARRIAAVTRGNRWEELKARILAAQAGVEDTIPPVDTSPQEPPPEAA